MATMTHVKELPLLKLQSLGQSVWLDYIDRKLIHSGQLERMIEEDGLSGVTSNPSIFEKAIMGSRDYDDDIARLIGEGMTAAEIYDVLTVQDVREAADVFRPVYDRSDGRDGYVSLEVSPHLARDTAGTIEEARRLWRELDRPNVLIKIPATEEGLPAIRQCIGEGININVTLLFSLARYLKVATAYIEGLEALNRQDKPLEHVASVASFFLSRIDTLIDPMLETIMGGGPGMELAGETRGQIAVCCAKAAYQMYKEIFHGRRFEPLARRGARPQRLLWASTSTKNPAYSDVMYVEPLIGPGTVNTLPMETLLAYRAHGRPEARLEEGIVHCDSLLARLPDLDIRLADVTAQLEAEGIGKFNMAYDKLIAALEGKGASV